MFRQKENIVIKRTKPYKIKLVIITKPVILSISPLTKIKVFCKVKI